MEHEELKVLVCAYHDDEVTAEERALVEAHVAECAECAETLAAYGRLGRTVRRLPRGAPSRDLWQRVQSGLAPRRGLFWRRLLPAAPVLALVAIVVTLAIVWGPQFGGFAPAQPAVQREAAVDKSAPSAAPEPQGSPLGAIVPASAGTAEEMETYGLTAAPPSPGEMSSLEVVSQTVQRGVAQAAPRLVGTLYDAAGQPLADTVLVVSDMVGWTGAVTTTADGAFALDLPAAGTYYVALAGSAEARVLEYNGTAADAAVSGTVYLTQTGYIAPLIVLEGNDEVVVTLRVR